MDLLYISPSSVPMASVHFNGWEVIDDVGVPLAADQNPAAYGTYTMFHGTSVDNARLIIAHGFKQSSDGLLGRGVYISRSLKKAAGYPRKNPPSDRVALELRARLGKVKRIDQDNHPQLKTWHDDGYNTAWIPPNCKMSAVPSGLEEDCVFNPKRVVVVGIAQAPTPAIENELKDLLAKHPRRPFGGRDESGCRLCRRKTQQGAVHVQQKCWKCGKTICILMAKHFCP